MRPVIESEAIHRLLHVSANGLEEQEVLGGCGKPFQPRTVAFGPSRLSERELMALSSCAQSRSSRLGYPVATIASTVPRGEANYREAV